MNHLPFPQRRVLFTGALVFTLSGAVACSSSNEPPSMAAACAQLGSLCSLLDAGAADDLDATVPCGATGTCTVQGLDANVVATFDAGTLPGFDASPWYPPPSGDDASLPPDDAAPPPPPPPVDAGPDCGTPPALHPEAQPGVYCPFTAAGPVHCPAAEQCCEAPIDAGGAASTCELLGATCPFAGSTVWACDGPVDCASSTAGPVCCGSGTLYADTACGYERGAAFTGSHCASSCGAGEVSICAAATDPCPSGTTCTPFKTEGVVLGTCL